MMVKIPAREPPRVLYLELAIVTVLIVVNGLGFEGWIDRLVRASGSKAPVLVSSQGITVRHVGKVVDPHAWQSLVAAQH